MSRNRRNYNRTAYDKRNGTDSKRADHIYIYGNTARRLEPQRRQEDPVKKPHHEVRKNRDKARHMSAGYVVFLTVALCAAAYILVNYVQLRAALTNLTEDQKDVVERKVQEMNDQLTHPKDGLPQVSLSVGAAFSEKGFTEELYRQADQALYEVKEHGRCGCRFYKEDGTEA